MILWHDNVVNSNLDYEDLVSKIMIDKYYVDNLDIHTTYQHGNSSPDNILIPFYSGVMEQLMSDLGLYHRSQYLFNIWTQIYSGNNNSAHNAHCHFSETNILSWVHFIKPPEKNCFCFIDSWEKNIFQSHKGKMILSYFHHGHFIKQFHLFQLKRE